MSWTNLAYATTRFESGNGVVNAVEDMVRCTMSGTDIAYAAPRCPVLTSLRNVGLSTYHRATRSPVLTWRMALPVAVIRLPRGSLLDSGTESKIGCTTTLYYAMCSTQKGYDATRSK
eukprot:3470989-Rhodomonas_salina.2